MEWQTGSKIPGVSGTVATESTRSISEFSGVHKALHGPPQNPEKMIQGICKANRRDYHTQSTCLEILALNVQVQTYHNEMSPRPVETTFGAKQMLEHRRAVPEVLLVEKGDTSQSPVKAVICMGE